MRKEQRDVPHRDSASNRLPSRATYRVEVDTTPLPGLLMAFTGPDDANCNVARRVGAWSPEEFVSNVKASLKGRTEGNT